MTLTTNPFGRTGHTTTRIGFGAWAIGGTWGEVSLADAKATLHAALDAGMTFIDTADVYGDGRSEQIIREVLAEPTADGLARMEDRFNDWFFAGGARGVGAFLSNVGDRSIIDGFFVNGSARVVGWTAALLRHIQSGYIYHYAFTMIIGLFALLYWWTPH